MKIISCFILFSIYFLTTLQGERKSDLVNPFIGTGGHGHTFPGPTMPFGGCQLSPDTRLTGWDGCSGYHESDSIIYGFSHTHLSGTGCSDYGDILLMPVTKDVTLHQYEYASVFSHKTEKAKAGYYEVQLETPQIHVSLTATLHGGVQQYVYPEGKEQYVVLDLKHRDEVLGSRLEKVDDYTIRGYRFSKAWANNQKVFFEIKFSKPIMDIQYGPQNVTGSQTIAIDPTKSLKCIVHFDQAIEGKLEKTIVSKVKLNRVLMVKCAISGVDEEGAHKNLSQEMKHWNFGLYQMQCEEAWDKELSKIQVESNFKDLIKSAKKKSEINLEQTETNKKIIFYTALYHCMIHPSLYSDVDGRYRGRDDKIHSTEGKFDYYTVFSLWDTYRALHPLLSIIDKKRTNDFIQTFIKQYEQNGRLPIWELGANETNCMIGYHVVSVIWDAYNKGIRDFDAEKAYEAMTRIATHYTHYTGSGLNLKLKDIYKLGSADPEALESYHKFGYIRSDDSHESVSKTLEYAYNDWCIAQMAKALGKTKDYEYYLKRSTHWQNIFDPTTGFMRARKNGGLYIPFSPYTVDNNYTEANSWQYSFYVPHDISTFQNKLGGKDKMVEQLNDLCAAKTQTEGRTQADITGLIGQYAHGNEPSHQIAYMYNFTEKPFLKQRILQTVLDSFYTNQPDGLIGNEDCGQMSAWYVMSAMGIYPVCPGNNQYAIGMPIFDRVFVNNEFQIKRNGRVSTPEQFYTYQNKLFITHQELLRKQIINLDFNTWGPHVVTTSNNKIQASPVTPFVTSGQRIFKDSLEIEFGGFDSQASEKLMISMEDKPFEEINGNRLTIYENTNLKFFTQRKNNAGVNSAVSEKPTTVNSKELKSYTQIANYTRLPKDRKIILKNTYNDSYHAGGAEGIMDGIFGKLNWRAGDWQGYQGQDVEIIMEFSEPRNITSVAANFLEDQNAWIFYPKQVSFYVGNDGLNWKLVEDIPTQKSDHNLEVTISKFTSKSKLIIPKSRYVKMVAKTFGNMPGWHEGRGNPTFIFIDELEVK